MNYLRQLVLTVITVSRMGINLTSAKATTIASQPKRLTTQAYNNFYAYQKSTDLLEILDHYEQQISCNHLNLQFNLKIDRYKIRAAL